MEVSMKKIILIMSMILMLALLNGCNKDKEDNEGNQNTQTPTTQPEITQPVEEEEEETLRIEDYYPLQADTEYVYVGEGNEYASYNRYTDYLDKDNNIIQTRTNNGGTETVRVIEIKDGKVSVIAIVNESYYRSNIMDKEVSEDESEILLMEPLVKGTEWELPDGRKRFISETETNIDTPAGSFRALEVTTLSEDSTVKDYYAYQVGLVKSVFESGDLEVSSLLGEINTDTPFTQTIDIFYPDVDEKIYVEQMTLSFRTGDVTSQVLQEAISKEVEKESYLPLTSTNTKINTLELGYDNIVDVDFSEELVKEMNAGAGYETLILQSITNTLGNYYGVTEVSITVDGKPYESGHVLMKEGETFKVNMDAVIR
jgi:hypothetical protein